MSREIPYDPEATCDECGAEGAFDFMGDLLCQACTRKALGGDEDKEGEDMSTKATIAGGEDWALEEENGEVRLHTTRVRFTPGLHGCLVTLPPAVIDAIRAAPASVFPHLRANNKMRVSE